MHGMPPSSPYLQHKLYEFTYSILNLLRCKAAGVAVFVPLIKSIVLLNWILWRLPRFMLRYPVCVWAAFLNHAFFTWSSPWAGNSALTQINTWPCRARPDDPKGRIALDLACAVMSGRFAEKDFRCLTQVTQESISCWEIVFLDDTLSYNISWRIVWTGGSR